MPFSSASFEMDIPGAGGSNELLFKLRRIIRAAFTPAGSHIFLHI
jgi:hypothetical protein